MLREVCIIVSNKKTGEVYKAKSYPDPDFDNDGKGELYETPVYYVYIDGTDDKGNSERKTWKAIRFMPFWNDPEAPHGNYKSSGWENSGLTEHHKSLVGRYDRYKSTSNRPSPHKGFIHIKHRFYIHAGPPSLDVWGWGAAGCIEIVGNYTDFKKDIQALSGSTKANCDDAITELVSNKKLYIQIDYAAAPKLLENKVKSHYYRIGGS